MDLHSSGASKKPYLIIGLVAVLLIGGALLIVGVAAGIVYYTRCCAREHIPPERPEPGKFPVTAPTSNDKTEALVSILKRRSKIGDFALQNIIPANENRVYGNSLGEARAIYSKDGATVTLLAAEYASRTVASVEFGRMMGRERSRGAKVVVQPRVNGDTINGAFETPKGKTVAFCSWPEGKAVLCHQISSTSGEAVNAFRQAVKASINDTF